jgi:hypothetical protein
MIRRKVLSAWCMSAALWAIYGDTVHADTIAFESPAKLHRLPRKPIIGTLVIDEAGIEFHSPKASHRWSYEEVKTFDLTGSAELTVTDYENRHWHEPGEQRFRFTLTKPIPPSLAGMLAARVGRPVTNGDPEPNPPSIAEIPAHRRDRFGGSNGRLRFREDGIDYLTANARDGRAWRWSDIQTIASSDPWTFRVAGYREIVEFDLKKPLAPDLFNRVWDRLYADGLNIVPESHGDHR